MCHRSRSIAAGGVLALLIIAPLGAQGVAAPPSVSGAPDTSTLPALPQAAGPLFTRADARIAGATALGAAALMLADRTITDEMASDAGVRDNRFLRHAASDFDWLGDPGTVIISAGLYGVGRLAHREHVAEFGLRGAEALVLSAVATEAIKGVAGRARPYLNDRDPDNFALGRPHTRLDRWLLPEQAGPDGYGDFMLGWHVPWQINAP